MPNVSHVRYCKPCSDSENKETSIYQSRTKMIYQDAVKGVAIFLCRYLVFPCLLDFVYSSFFSMFFSLRSCLGLPHCILSVMLPS